MRKAHINHEASFRSIGTLYFLWAAFFITLGGFAALTSAAVAAASGVGAFGFVGVLLVFAIAGGFIVTGIAMRRLRLWARWVSLAVALGFAALILLGMLHDGESGGGFVLIFPIVVIYLVLHPKSKMLCSAAYRDIIAQTPHIKYKRSLLSLIGMVLLVLLIIAAIGASAM